MLRKQPQLLESVSLSLDPVPLGFVISDDGRAVLAVTGHRGHDDGILELATTPVAFIQPTTAIPPPVIRLNNAPSLVKLPLLRISLDNGVSNSGQQSAVMEPMTCEIGPAEGNNSFSSEANHVEPNDTRLTHKETDIPRLESIEANLDDEQDITSDLPKSPVKRSPGRPRKDATSASSIAADKMRCDICGQEFTRQALYRRHMEHHAAEKPHRCPKCSASFNVPTNFTLHMATHNTGEPKCPECGRKFARMASLKSHMILHQKEESLFCTECEDAFSTKSRRNKCSTS